MTSFLINFFFNKFHEKQFYMMLQTFLDNFILQIKHDD